MAGNYRKATSAIANKFVGIKVEHDYRRPHLLNVSRVGIVSHTRLVVGECSGALEEKDGIYG